VQAKKNISGFASESDADELPDSKVDVEQKSLLSGNQSFKKQFNIRLHVSNSWKEFEMTMILILLLIGNWSKIEIEALQNRRRTSARKCRLQ